MRFLTIIGIVTIFSLEQCNRPVKPPEVAGGPCDYKTTLLPVKVIYVFANSKDADALMVIEQNERLTVKDTLLFSAAIGRNITPEEAEKFKMKEGTVYTYEIKDIISGSCTNHLERFLPEIFNDSIR